MNIISVFLLAYEGLVVALGLVLALLTPQGFWPILLLCYSL